MVDLGSPTPDRPDASIATSGSVGSTAAIDADARSTALDRVVREWTREDRAALVDHGEFEAHLVRGERVDNLRHAVVLIVLGAIAVAARLGGLGAALSTALPVVAAGYAVFWAFLALTGGEEFDTLSVDETGSVTVRRTGRLIEVRGDTLRVGIPAVALLVCAYLGTTLSHDIAYPPPPHCNPMPSMGPDFCSLTPVIDVNGQASGAISKQNLIVLERLLRALQLLAVAVVTLGAALVEWAMLTGRDVFIVTAPVFVQRRQRAGPRRKTG